MSTFLVIHEDEDSLVYATLLETEVDIEIALKIAGIDTPLTIQIVEEEDGYYVDASGTGDSIPGRG